MELVLKKERTARLPIYVILAYCGIVVLVILNGAYGLWELLIQSVRQKSVRRVLDATGLCCIFMPLAIVMLCTVAVVYRIDPDPFDSEAYRY